MNAIVPARKPNPSISCVVPAYNEAANLPQLLAVLTAQLRQCTPAWEVLVVDDGSRDMTAAALQPWLLEPGVRYLRLSRNFGKEVALSAGIDHARGDLVVLLDADLQHPPEMIPLMLEAWRQGADMVCAARQSRADESWSKRVGTPVPGWATIVVSVSFFGGMQLLSIGILGEYVGRIFDEVKQRPVYLIGSEAGRGAIQLPGETQA